MIVEIAGTTPVGEEVAEGGALCVPLDAATDASLVGGKAFALGRLIRAGVAVPEGFVLTTGALDGHLGGFGDTATASTQRRRGAEEQQELLSTTALSPGVREALAAHAASLLAKGPVVVRSSAVGEDGAGESFAGQLDSILNVRDDVQLERAVRDVWASLWSERVDFYRTARGVPMRGMGVVVQRQVDARVAGVMFTMTSTGEMLVEYGAGLADKLVAGEVDPARMAINRATGASRQLRRDDDCSLTERQIEQLRLVGLAADHGAGDDSGRASGERTTDLVVERERQRELSAADLAVAVLDRGGGVHALFPQPRRRVRRVAGARSRDGAGVSANHRRARRADVLQPDVDSFGAAPRAVR
jgi:hypothetical protein